MTYKEYPWLNKTFVVVWQSGFGLMESPLISHGVVWASDTYSDAHSKGEELFPKNPANKGWDYESFSVHINISTNIGKKLFDEHNINNQNDTQNNDTIS